MKRRYTFTRCYRHTHTCTSSICLLVLLHLIFLSYPVQVSPLIPPENLPYVHHQFIFLCPLGTAEAHDGVCGDVFFGCFGGQIIAAWAVGGEVSQE